MESSTNTPNPSEQETMLPPFRRNILVRIPFIILNALGATFIVFAYYMEIRDKFAVREFERQLGATSERLDTLSISWLPLLVCLPAFLVACVACARFSKFWAWAATLFAFAAFFRITSGL